MSADLDWSITDSASSRDFPDTVHGGEVLYKYPALEQAEDFDQDATNSGASEEIVTPSTLQQSPRHSAASAKRRLMMVSKV